jgi:LAO/AO transport system kinase
MSRMDAIAERVLAGDARAVARAISIVENGASESSELMAALFPSTGRAYVVGVTGPPGAGKSSLVDRLTAGMRRPSGNARPACTVGVVAIDPTSPFTGGAVLGDRVRMQAHAGDAGVFIRSMATRGHLGGLSRATSDAVLVLDASGKDVVLIETVGVGQDEVDIVRTADVSIVVLVPGAGDDVQALKAGIMEIADVFVVNKADREGADRVVSAIEANLALKEYGAGEWRPPIVKTVATSGEGLGELMDRVDAFRARGGSQAALRRHARSEHRLREVVSREFMDHLERTVLGAGEFDALVNRMAAREVDPYTAARELLARAGVAGLR